MEKINSLADSFSQIWDSLESDVQLAIVFLLLFIFAASIALFLNERRKKKKYLKKHDGIVIKKQKDQSHLKAIEESRLKNQNLFRSKKRI